MTLFDARDDSRVRVFRRDDKTMKFILHGYLPPSSAEEDVAALYGGGHYRCQLIVPGELGRGVIQNTREFDIPGPYRPPVGELPGVGPQSRAVAGAPAGAVASTNVDLGGNPGSAARALDAAMVGTVIDLLKVSREVTQRPVDNGLADALKEMARQQAEDRQIMFRLLEKLATPAPGPTRSEMLAEMQQMKALIGTPTEQGRERLTELVGAIKELREVSEELSPEPRRPSDPLEYVPAVLGIIQAEQARRAGGKPAAPRLPASNSAPAATAPAPAPSPSPETEAASPMWKRILQAEGARLVYMASTATPPDDVATTALTLIPAQYRGAINEFFAGESAEVTARLTAEVPGLQEFPAWASEFVLSMQDLLFGEPEDDPDADPAAPVPPTPPVH